MPKPTSEKKTTKINSYFKNTPIQSSTSAPKRSNSNLSPSENSPLQKKINMNPTPEKETKKTSNDKATELAKTVPEMEGAQEENSDLKNIIEPLIEEVKLLRKSFHEDILSMDKKIEDALQTQKEELVRLEECMKTQTEDTTQLLTSKIYNNASNINQLLEENRKLKMENTELWDRLTKIEKSQLNNNVILSGMPEAPWERYEIMKE